jgi:hypothetical protein
MGIDQMYICERLFFSFIFVYFPILSETLLRFLLISNCGFFFSCFLPTSMLPLFFTVSNHVEQFSVWCCQIPLIKVESDYVFLCKYVS